MHRLRISSACCSAIGGIVWLAGIAYGARWWMAYDHTPGPTAGIALQWPQTSHLPREPRRGTLVMFAHPHCACTRASLRRLTDALNACAVRPNVYVLFSPVPSADENDESRRLAQAIPGAHVAVDRDVRETTAFGATTSGHTVFYDAEGRLRFAGGLTAERGDVRECEYDGALLRVLTVPQYPLVRTPVFGCGLVRSDEG